MGFWRAAARLTADVARTHQRAYEARGRIEYWRGVHAEHGIGYDRSYRAEMRRAHQARELSEADRPDAIVDAIGSMPARRTAGYTIATAGPRTFYAIADELLRPATRRGIRGYAPPSAGQ